MKRDMELIRKILLVVEESQGEPDLTVLFKDGYDEAALSYNAWLTQEAGLTAGIDPCWSDSDPYPAVFLRRLTWQGHEFLDAARNEPRWKGVMGKVKSAGGGVTLAVLQSLLSDALKQQIGIP
ncbi:MAG TPA: DUF2513 domain-containing protein [Pirellulaceae bacterium]